MTFIMNKPIHKVLEDYDLLNVSVIQNTNTINMSAAMLWKMNMCAVSDEIPCTFFVAMNYRVNVYTLDTIYSKFKDPIKTLVSPEARQTGGGSDSPFIINYIKIGRLLEKEVLVTCSENGQICIYRTENLDEPPMILQNDAATWGIAIHADQGLLAVSANSWKITIYNILKLTKSNPIFGKRPNRRTTNILGSESSIELLGHEHNIPYIDFNETGRYLASASIDQTCRVWDLKTKQVVSQRNHARQNPTMEQDFWYWSVKFIKPGNFKFAVCVDKTISKAYLQRLYQGRSTSLVNLGLSHSATSPSFPMGTAGDILDLGDGEFDITIYETESEGIDDDAWDETLLREEEDAMEDIYERQRQADTYSYNHGEIQNEIRREQNTEDEEGEDNEDRDNNYEEIRIGPVISYRTEGEVDNELQSEYNFNLSRREGLLQEARQEQQLQSHESEELIQQQDIGALEDQQDEDYLEDDDEEYEDAEPLSVREGIEVWTTPPATLRAQDDWVRTIDNTAQDRNRDGWSDEIVTTTQSIIPPTYTHPVNVHADTARSTVRDRLQTQVRYMQDVASFINDGNGWESNDDSIVEDSIMEQDDAESTGSNDSGSTGNSSNNDNRRPYCIPNIIKSTRSSSILAAEKQHFAIEKKKKQLNHHNIVGEYLMISTGKDVMLMSTSTPKMNRIRAGHGLINKVDVRSDQMLSLLDRINMVEWLPELELYVAASQKGTVALMRILQVEFEGGEQACIFNNECYLPTTVLQSTPLYGMTVQKVEGERFTPISYRIFLFYYSGNVLSYSVSRKDSDLFVENLMF